MCWSPMRNWLSAEWNRIELGWKPVEERPRQVSASLKAYAKLATSADKGAVRDLSQLDSCYLKHVCTL